MEAEEIAEVYNTLAPMSTDYANANIERIGQAQSSYGPLAQAAMGDSQTAGVGNYTYNRLVRPTVDTLRDQLIVEGISSALNKQISDSLKAAKENYSNAYKAYSRKYGSGGSGGGSAGGTGGTGDTDSSVWNGDIDVNTVDSKTVNKVKNNGMYALFTVETPAGTRVQWKYNALGGFDTPVQSYTASSGLQKLQSIVNSGGKIYDSNGNDITSNYR